MNTRIINRNYLTYFSIPPFLLAVSQQKFVLSLVDDLAWANSVVSGCYIDVAARFPLFLISFVFRTCVARSDAPPVGRAESDLWYSFIYDGRLE